jgi:hypothetical protein
MIKDLKARSATYEADRVARRSRGHNTGSHEDRSSPRSSNQKLENYQEFSNRRSAGPSAEDRYGPPPGPGGYSSAPSPPHPQEAAGHYQPLQAEPYGPPSGGYSGNPGYDGYGGAHGGAPGMPSAYPPGYAVPNQGIPPVPAPGGGYSRDAPYGQPGGYNPYGNQGQAPRGEQPPYAYPSGNPGYDSRGRDHLPGGFYGGPPGDRAGGGDAMQGVMSPGNEMYNNSQQPPFAGRQAPSGFGAPTGPPGRGDYSLRQSDSYNQGSRRR